MKNVLLFSIVFCTIVMPVFADLTPQDFDKFRALLKEELDPLKAEIKALDKRLQKVEQDISWIRGKLEGVDKQFDAVDKRFDAVDKRFDAVDKQISHSTNLTYGLIALIVAAVGIPQIIMVWRSRGESAQDRRIEELARAQDRRIEELTREIEALKQQQIVNP